VLPVKDGFFIGLTGDFTQCEQLSLNRQNLSSVTTIDFCLDDICRIDWLTSFPGLRELHVV